MTNIIASYAPSTFTVDTIVGVTSAFSLLFQRASRPDCE